MSAEPETQSAKTLHLLLLTLAVGSLLYLAGIMDVDRLLDFDILQLPPPWQNPRRMLLFAQLGSGASYGTGTVAGGNSRRIPGRRAIMLLKEVQVLSQRNNRLTLAQISEQPWDYFQEIGDFMQDQICDLERLFNLEDSF